MKTRLQVYLLIVMSLSGVVNAAAQTRGQTLFEANCAVCHQPDGSGTVGLAPALKGEHWKVLGSNPNYLPTVMLKGLSGRIEVNGQTFSGSMPSFAAQFDDASLADIAQHVRTLQGNPSVINSAQDWAVLRQTAGSPPQTRQLRLSLLEGK